MSKFEADLRDIKMANYDYDLPIASIAKWPVENRHDAKLLIYNNGNIDIDTYRNIADRLPENAFLVFNDTRVIAARLPFKKSTGGNIEIFLLEPKDGIDHAIALSQKNTSTWKCLVGGRKRGDPLLFWRYAARARFAAQFAGIQSNGC